MRGKAHSPATVFVARIFERPKFAVQFSLAADAVEHATRFHEDYHFAIEIGRASRYLTMAQDRRAQC